MYNQLSKSVTVTLPVRRKADGNWEFDTRTVKMSDFAWSVARDSLDALLEQAGNRFESSRELYLWLSGWMLCDATGNRDCRVLVEPLGVLTLAPALVTHTAQLCLIRLTDYR